MNSNFEGNPWLWPISAALRVSAATLDAFGALSAIGVEPARRLEPAWTTPHSIVLELPQLRLRQFGEGDGRPVVVVAPYAVHGPVLADLAPGHSLIARLLAEGLTRVVLVEWKSATPAMRFLRIDDYLALLLVVVVELGAPLKLVGLCQGGWLSLMFAARSRRRSRLSFSPVRQWISMRRLRSLLLLLAMRLPGASKGSCRTMDWSPDRSCCPCGASKMLRRPSSQIACRSMRQPMTCFSDFRFGMPGRSIFREPTTFRSWRTSFAATSSQMASSEPLAA
jgi:hypothetical protein